MFASLCFLLLFQRDSALSFAVSLKMEIVVITIFLLLTYAAALFFPSMNHVFFIFWDEIVYSLLFLRFILIICLPFILGHIVLKLIDYKEISSYQVVPASFFIGVFIMIFSYVISDLIKIPKDLGIMLMTIIILLIRIFREVAVKRANGRFRRTHFSISLYDVIIFVFAILSYSSVYSHRGSFLKGDLWKQTVLASSIQLGSIEKYVSLRNKDLFSYPLPFSYFLASTAHVFSFPLINFTMVFATLIPAVSALAMFCFFSAIEGGSKGKAGWATLVWFTFSGFGSLYLLLIYGNIHPSPNLALIIMEKLGWGSGLIYSPSLGSFEHILRVFSISGTLFSLSTLIQHNISPNKTLLLGVPILIIAILFHPLMAVLSFIFTWLALIFTKPEITFYSGITFALSLGIIMLFDFFFSPKHFYFNNLSVFAIFAVTILTTIANNVPKNSLFLKFRVGTNVLFIKVVLVIALLGYIYSLSLLYWNYDVLFLDRFPTVPIYAWSNIGGIAGLLTLSFLGNIMLRKRSSTFSEKYSIILLTLIFGTSLAFDYNNTNQVIKIFDPNLISFRLIPIFAIPTSYLAGSQLSGLSEIINFRNKFCIPSLIKKIVTLTLIIIILIFVFASFLSRDMFWINANWPSSNFEKYQIREEELRLIHYLSNHVTQKEIVALEDGSIMSLSRFGEASPLGRIVALSGASVISKELGYILFQARSIEMVNLLKETLDIRHIVIRKSPEAYNGAPSYLKDMLLSSINPIFETDNYVVYNFSLPLNISEAPSIPRISNAAHCGIFSREVTLLGKITIRSDYLYIEKLRINNLTLTKLKFFGNIVVTLFNAEGILISSAPNSKYSLNFNGIDNYVEVPNIITSKPFTLQFWTKVNDIQQSNILDSRDRAFVNGGKGLTIEDVEGDGFYQIGLGDGSHFILSQRVIDLSDLKWHNIIISCSKTKMKIYVDGVLKQTIDVSELNTSINGTSKIRIGTGLSGYFNGRIDNVLVYDRALGVKEIRFNRLSPDPSKKRLQLMFDIEEGSGEILWDKSGNTNSGVIHGCSWHTNRIKIQLAKPTRMRLNVSSISNDKIKDDRKGSVIAEVHSSLILSEKPNIKIEGTISLKDAILTWPYIDKVGSQGDLNLSGIISFRVLDTKDRYIPLMLNLSDNYVSYHQNTEKEWVVKFTQHHYNSINFFFRPNLFLSSDIYATLIFLLLFPSGCVLLTYLIPKGDEYNRRN